MIVVDFFFSGGWSRRFGEWENSKINPYGGTTGVLLWLGLCRDCGITPFNERRNLIENHSTGVTIMI